MGNFLAETIESVLANLRDGDEYYVIDGGSTDGSVEIIRRYENRLSGWISEHDRGYADAISKGLARSSGSYQCWVNSGDLLLRGALDLARNRLDLTGADMIFGDDFYIDEDSNVIGFSRGSCRDLRAAMLYGAWTPLQDACFWRANIYDQAGGLNVNLRDAADYDLFARFAVIGRTHYEPSAFGAFRRHVGQRSLSHKERYRREKAKARKTLLRRSAGSPMVKGILRVYFVIAIRWRAHVLRRLWDRADLHGCHVGEFSAGPYWPPKGSR